MNCSLQVWRVYCAKYRGLSEGLRGMFGATSTAYQSWCQTIVMKLSNAHRISHFLLNRQHTWPIRPDFRGASPSSQLGHEWLFVYIHLECVVWVRLFYSPQTSQSLANTESQIFLITEDPIPNCSTHRETRCFVFRLKSCSITQVSVTSRVCGIIDDLLICF